MAKLLTMRSQQFPKNIRRFIQSCTEQPRNLCVEQSRQYYNGFKVTCVDIDSLNPLAKEFVPKVKNSELNVPVFNDKGHGHSCLGIITDEHGNTNTRSIIQYNRSMVYEQGCVENSINTNSQRCSVISIDNTYSNRTCNVKHGALYGFELTSICNGHVLLNTSW